MDMRQDSNKNIIQAFMQYMGEHIRQPVSVYLTGGATAVLLGFRPTTVDVDIKFEPEQNDVYYAIRKLKDELNINIELASPDNFIPPLPGWKENDPHDCLI